MASFQGPFTDLLEHFCDFSSSKCLEYCLKEPTTNYEGLNIGYWQLISVNILYCTYGTFGAYKYEWGIGLYTVQDNIVHVCMFAYSPPPCPLSSSGTGPSPPTTMPLLSSLPLTTGVE